MKHYTQQPSQLRTSSAEAALVEVRGGGFVTRQMLNETLKEWRKRDLASGILVDLREVAGYESGCAALAQRWLLDAHQFGVQRIAFVASSSVLRTATHLVSSRTAVALRMFEDETAARAWLSTGFVATSRPLVPPPAPRPRV